jgi:hypothetical protein
MPESLCNLIDDYLARDLFPDKEEAFRAHLLGCQNCRAQVKQHERLAATLTEAVGVLCPVPDHLLARTRARLLSARRRRAVRWLVGAAAAAALLWVVSQSLPRKALKLDEQPAETEQVAGDRAPPAPEVQLTFAQESKLLIVPEKTDSPDVTFVWVFRNQRSAQ